MGKDQSEAIARGVKVEAPKTPAKPAADIKILLEAIKVAVLAGDTDAILLASANLSKAKGEIARAQAAALQAEATALAGAREILAVNIFKAVKALPNIATQLKSVKATGFSFSLDMPDANGVMTIQKSVSLAVPSIKKHRGTGGGAIGKTKDEYGMSLSEVFEKFANAEDRAKYAAAASNSGQWQVKVAVKKRAIAEGLLKPAK